MTDSDTSIVHIAPPQITSGGDFVYRLAQPDRALGRIPGVLSASGIFICSGILEKNKAEVIQKMKYTGFEIIEIRTQEDWVAIAGRVS